MKKKTNIIKTLFLSMVCSITIGLQSCGDYLDVEEYIDQMTFLDSVFSRKELLDQRPSCSARRFSSGCSLRNSPYFTIN